MTEDIQQVELSEMQEQLVEQLPEMIKVFHFINGHVVVGTVEEFRGDYALTYRPFTVTRTYSPEQELLGISFAPYLSDIVDKDEIISLNLKQTITVTNPSPELMKAYIAGCLIIDEEDDDEELTDEQYDSLEAEEHLVREEKKTDALQKKKVYH
jgi:hypothetical protein